jgi:uncharacterized protein YbaA (DUF1428 family)
MAYVDGYVLPVPTARLAEYRRLARRFGRMWIEYGALAVTECAADDVQPGKLTSFPRAVQLKDDETVVISWIVFRNKRDRDRINRAVMADPRMAAVDPAAMPVDGQRMFWGGFKPLVELP